MRPRPYPPLPNEIGSRAGSYDELSFDTERQCWRLAVRDMQETLFYIWVSGMWLYDGSIFE